MSVAKYADVAKAAKDLLSKPYPETHKLEIKTSAANGVVFTTETLLGPSTGKTAALTVKGEGVVSGNFKVDKLSLDTNRELVGEFSLAEVAKGTKLTFKAKDGVAPVSADAKGSTSASLGVEHRADFGTITADIHPLKQALDFSAVFGFDNFLAGANVSVAKGAALQLTDYGALVGYKNKDVAVSVAGEKKFNSFLASYHQNVNPTLVVAAQASVPRDVKDASKFALTAGVQYKPAPDVTYAGKATHTGKFALSYAQQLSSVTKVTIGAEIDSARIPDDKAHKLAILVNFSA